MKTGSCDRCGEPFVHRSKRARRFCTDNCRKRYQEATTGRSVCKNCGELAGTSSKSNGHDRCWACRQAEADRVRLAVFEGYRAGKTPYEIAEETDIPILTVTSTAYKMRQEGLDVPYAPMGTASHRSYRVA